MKKPSHRRLFFVALLLPCLAALSAHAACTNPAGVERDFIYNGDYHTYQFCNGTKWVVAGGTVAPEAFNQQIGYIQNNSSPDTSNRNTLLAMPVTLTYPGTIQSLSIDVTTAAGKVIMGLYDASGTGGDPNVLKATTASFTPTTGWNTVNVVTPVWLPAGNYWVAWDSDNNSLAVATQVPGSQNTYPATFGALPNPVSGSNTPFQNADDVYATFTGAGCASPTGNESDTFYNTAFHTLQFCNGDMWISMGQGSGGGGGGCTSPAGKERDIIYSGDFHTYQFCNGTNWVKYGGGVWQGTTPTSGVGYFVMSKSTWNGNLGWLTGADAKCLTELTTNTGWKGYAAANANGQLISAKVHAFICDGEGGSGCINNLNANTTYYFANANNSAIGGNRFTTDSSGQGPYDNADWSTNSYFGGSYTYWTDRRVQAGTFAASAWSTLGQTSGQDCANPGGGVTAWNNGTSSFTGYLGDTIPPDTGAGRWQDLTATNCNTLENLICYVNP